MSEELPGINQRDKAGRITNLLPNTTVELEKTDVDDTWSFKKIDSNSVYTQQFSKDTSNILYSVVELPGITTTSLNKLLDKEVVSKITVRIEKQLLGEFIAQLDHDSKKKAVSYVLQSNSRNSTERQNGLIQNFLQVFKRDSFTFQSVKHEQSNVAEKIYDSDDRKVQISTKYDYSPIVHKLDQGQSLFNIYIEIELSKPLNKIKSTNLHTNLHKMNIEIVRADRHTKSDLHILTEGLLTLLGIET